MTIQAKIIADSISPFHNKRITTFQLLYPRFIHAELMTHRVFSRNASSSRAIPVSKMLAMVREDPAMPIHWGRNQPGMQANEQLFGGYLDKAQQLWLIAAKQAANIAENMMNLGLHKQAANRILEPFQHISVVLTATEFDNWFELRAHPDAQPEIQFLATEMQEAMNTWSEPKLLKPGEWHLPYVTDTDIADVRAMNLKSEVLRQISAARCCRVSYLKHDGTAASIADDLDLCDKLVGAKPLHASPFEHQATPDTLSHYDTLLVTGDKEELVSSNKNWDNPELHGNFTGWIQYRKQIEHRFK